VAIIGAGGIGKHHAKWWAIEGAEVCAIAGTSHESLAKAEAGLKALFPYDGRSYTDIALLLERERPDIVDVCSPPHWHYAHVRQALEAGCDVLCEKPLVYDREMPIEDLKRQAKALLGLAADRRRRLGLCTQYSVGARMFLDIWRERFGDEPIQRIYGHLESPAKGRPADPERVWVDLGPHPLSVLQRVAPGCHMTDLTTTFEGYEARARFRLSHVVEVMKERLGRSDEPIRYLDCEVVTRNSVDPPQNVREFRFNDYSFKVDGVTDKDGIYCARIVTPDGEYIRPDMMRLTVREFLQADWIGNGVAGEVNLILLLEILRAARGA
jgi:hypothetical protein